MNFAYYYVRGGEKLKPFLECHDFELNRIWLQIDIDLIFGASKMKTENYARPKTWYDSNMGLRVVLDRDYLTTMQVHAHSPTYVYNLSIALDV